MDREASAHDLLEGILLDENKDPTNFPIGLLESITDDFSNDQKIGSGGFADVYKGQLQSGIVAVKKLKELSRKVEDLEVHEKKFMQEVDSLMKVKHKNIVRFLGYCFDTQGKVLKHKGKNIMAEERQRFLCFEFLPQGSLDMHISDPSSGLEWRTRYHIIKGICEGLQYLHGKKIVHADLKPENILLDHNMMPKIGDFGLARSFLEEQTSAITQNVFGTFGYMAPESFRGVITFKSDIYSLGVIITEMLTGQKKDDLSIESVHVNWTARFKTSHGGTWLEHVAVCAEIGLDCMDFDPKKRPTIGQIIDRLDELEHKYGSIGTDLPVPATHELDVYPLYIWFPLESDKVIKCPVTLTNKTDDLICVLVSPTNIAAYSYVWEQPRDIKIPQNLHNEDPEVLASIDPGFKFKLHLEEFPVRKSSIFISLGPHSSKTIYMTKRKPRQPPKEAGLFDVVMVAMKSEKDLECLDLYWHDDFWWKDKPEDTLRRAKDLGTVVHLATLRAADRTYAARRHEVAAHEFKPMGADEKYFFIECMDAHPTKTWLLVAYRAENSYVFSIWNYVTQERVTKFEVNHSKEVIDSSRIASVKFIPGDGEQWFAVGGWRGLVHVYTYTNFGAEKEVKEFEAYVDDEAPVVHLDVSPKHTLLLTASRSCPGIKLWDWSQGWTCTRVIDTHGRRVHGLKVNPRDASTFASITGYDNPYEHVVKVWDIHSPDAIATFEGLSFTFYTDSRQDFLATIPPSRRPYCYNAKIWDIQKMKHVHTLWPRLNGGNWSPILCSHPTLPILAVIMDGSSKKPDEIVMWDVSTYRVVKRIELLTGSVLHQMVFNVTTGITSLLVLSGDRISIIKINVSTLLGGC